MKKVFSSDFRVTQEFGVNPDYYKKFKDGNGKPLKGHEGIDLVPTDNDKTVRVVADGVVVRDDDLAGDPKVDAYGIYVTVWHPQLKKATQYTHLASNQVFLNQQLKMGEPIGIMGKTGNTNGGEHVHFNLFEVDNNGMRLNYDNGYLGGINPLPFLMEEDTVTPPAGGPSVEMRPTKIRVTAAIGVYGRPQPSTENTPTQVFQKGIDLDVLEVVKGQKLKDNDVWYKVKKDNLYVWSGVTEVIKSEPVKKEEIKVNNVDDEVLKETLSGVLAMYKLSREILIANNALPGEADIKPENKINFWSKIKEALHIK